MIKCKIITGQSSRFLEENVNQWLSKHDYGIYNQSFTYSMQNSQKEPYMMSIFYDDNPVTGAHR